MPPPRRPCAPTRAPRLDLGEVGVRRAELDARCAPQHLSILAFHLVVAFAVGRLGDGDGVDVALVLAGASSTIAALRAFSSAPSLAMSACRARGGRSSWSGWSLVVVSGSGLFGFVIYISGACPFVVNRAGRLSKLGDRTALTAPGPVLALTCSSWLLTKRFDRTAPSLEGLGQEVGGCSSAYHPRSVICRAAL